MLLINVVSMSIKALFIPWNESVFAFVEEVRRQDFKPVLHNVFLSIGNSSDSVLPKMFLCAATSDFGEGSTLPESLALELFAHPLRSLSRKFVLPFLNNRPHFFTPLIKHLNNLAVNFR